MDPIKMAPKQQRAVPERISADELAYHRYIEARHVAALQVIAARSEWHAYLVEKFGLKSGVDQIAPDGAILRLPPGEIP